MESAQLLTMAAGKSSAQAFQKGAPDDDPTKDIDTFFLLFSAYLVVFMQVGFGLLSAGSVRTKNTKAIFMKILLNTGIAAVCYYISGFAIAFGGEYDEGKGSNAFMGYSYFGLVGVPPEKMAFFLFQFAVTAACCSIVVGAIEERMNFLAYITLTVYVSAFVYPVAAHWTWAESGWLSAFRTSGAFLGTGIVDFAGCGAVHMLGGFTGLLGAKILGPRIGRFGPSGKPMAIHGHSATLTVTGVLMLWVGWYGFNPGSSLAIITNSDMVATAAVNTTMAAAFGTLSSLVMLMLMEYRASGEVVWDLEGCGNGCLAGLVAVTASASFIPTWAASITGFVGGVLYCLSSYFVLNVLKIDDPLDAASVHGANGMWGLIAAAAFATKSGLADVYDGMAVTTVPHAKGFLVGGDATLLVCALTGLASVLAWVVVTMVPFFHGLKMLKSCGVELRVSAAAEAAGLDIANHGGPAYVADDHAADEEHVASADDFAEALLPPTSNTN